MKAEELERVERYFGPYADQPAFEPAVRLVAHCRELQRSVAELQAFVSDLAAHHAKPGSPAKTAEHYQLVRRCEALRQQFEPVRGRG
jgi:hypothetical protein